MNLIRTPEDSNRFMLALTPVDEAFRRSEAKWGVGRLERLQRTEVLSAYQRGWDAYRVVLETGDGPALEELGPKMIRALEVMDTEATAAGHKPLDPSTWECPLEDGVTLVLVRSQAEQSAVIRQTNGKVYTASPSGGMTVSSETTLPADIAIAVRSQHEGRALEVWTIGEVAALIRAFGSVARPPRKWEGSPAPSGVQRHEGFAADIVRTGYPLDNALEF